MGDGPDLLFTLRWKSAEISQKIWEDLFFWRTPDFSRKIGVSSRKSLFFWRTLAPCVFDTWPCLEHSCRWPREVLSSRSRSLASDFFCVVGLEDCVLDSTSVEYCIGHIGLLVTLVYWSHYWSHMFFLQIKIRYPS